MALKFTTLDVFTQDLYAGNQLAIIHVPASATLSQTQKQRITREFNYDESVFLHEQTDEDKEAGIVRADIFTPWAEIPFGGHPVVGTANYLLRHLQGDDRNPAFVNVQALQLKAGRFAIALTKDETGVQVQLAHDVHIHQSPFADREFGHLPVVSIVKGMTSILAKQESLERLAAVDGNLVGPGNAYTSHDALDNGWRDGLVGTHYWTELSSDTDGVRTIRSRNFGDREDPASGSAASALCSYLSLSEEGPAVRKYNIIQGVEMGRRSDINIQVSLGTEGGHKVIEKILLSGSAVQVMEGKLRVPFQK